MAIKTYTAGKLVNNGTQIGNVGDFTLTINMGTEEKTSFGATWLDHSETIRGWSLSGTCYYDPADTAQVALRTAYTTGSATLSALQIWEDASHYYGGSGILTNATITKSVGSPDRLSISILGKPALTYT